MREETVNGVDYPIGRLTAKQQFNVLRRLGPVFAAAKPAAKLWVEQAAKATDTGEKPAFDTAKMVDDIFDSVGPLATALGTLTDETTDYVLGTCLSVVMVNRSGASWAPMANKSGQLMFEDLELMTMLRLVLLVIQDNMSSFFPAVRGASPGVQ